ncbi:unnamed protein product [Chrysoparadoxa australica]
MERGQNGGGSKCMDLLGLGVEQSPRRDDESSTSSSGGDGPGNGEEGTVQEWDLGGEGGHSNHSRKDTMQSIDFNMEEYTTRYFDEGEGWGGGALGAAEGDGLTSAREAIFDAKAKYYTAPSKTSQLIYCSLTRHRGRHATSFHLHRDDTGEFLLACTVAADMKGPFIFHTTKDSHLRTLKDITSAPDSATYLGCMIPSFLGTEFRLMDYRVDARDAGAVKCSEDTGIFELQALSFEVNVLGRVPNSMKIMLRPPLTKDQRGPKPLKRQSSLLKQMKMREDGGDGVEFSVTSPVRSFKEWATKSFGNMKADESSQQLYSETQEEAATYTPVWRGGNEGAGSDEDVGEREAPQDASQDGMLVFETLPPVWNHALDSWVLNFNGRVKIPSKKNFLAAKEEPPGAQEMTSREGRWVPPETKKEQREVFLRTGKMSKSTWSVDFQWPFSPITALATCCSSFADKKVVT